MKLTQLIIKHTEAALRDVMRLDAPADVNLSYYFRTHPKLGGRERNAIAEGIYAVLRNKVFFTDFACVGGTATMHRLALLGLAHVFGAESLAVLPEGEKEWLKSTAAVDRTLLPEAMRANLPQWLLDKLQSQYGADQAMALAASLNQPAPLDMRVNALKSSRDDAFAALKAAGIDCELMPLSPVGIRTHKKFALNHITLFKNGALEVQDEGSQLLAQITGAKRGEMVADFCAGAGGKALALGAQMRNTGRLYAFDVSDKRLAKLTPRLARSGLSNVHPVRIAHENDARIKRLAGKIDRVLVDAPCSGTGTLRRNPDIAWRQSPEAVASLQTQQIAILSSAARLVKKGGRLVYATCSLLREENEDVVESFLASHPDFALMPMSEVLAEQKLALEMQEFLVLLPHLHHTDGFFAAALVKKA